MEKNVNRKVVRRNSKHARSHSLSIYIFLPVSPPPTQKGEISIYIQPTGRLQKGLNIEKYLR